MYRLVLDWGFLVVVLGALTAAGIFWVRGALEFGEGMPRLAPPARRHGSTLLGLFLLLKAGSYLLQRYDLLLDATGVVVGAGYTDLNFHLPFLTVLVGLALVGTALCVANLWVGGLRLPALAVILVLAGSLSASVGAALFQSYRVKPDELRLEAPYIAHNIALTRYGFGLDRITGKPFPADGQLTPRCSPPTTPPSRTSAGGIRGRLLDTYRQLQEIRLYYDFHDVDVDRYTLDGRYQQVMLSARELNQSRLPRGRADVDQSALQVHARLRSRR